LEHYVLGHLNLFRASCFGPRGFFRASSFIFAFRGGFTGDRLFNGDFDFPAGETTIEQLDQLHGDHGDD
jgi:hypothetical protein